MRMMRKENHNEKRSTLPWLISNMRRKMNKLLQPKHNMSKKKTRDSELRCVSDFTTWIVANERDFRRSVFDRQSYRSARTPNRQFPELLNCASPAVERWRMLRKRVAKSPVGEESRLTFFLAQHNTLRYSTTLAACAQSTTLTARVHSRHTRIKHHAHSTRTSMQHRLTAHTQHMHKAHTNRTHIVRLCVYVHRTCVHAYACACACVCVS